jgi:hypothetical protein
MVGLIEHKQQVELIRQRVNLILLGVRRRLRRNILRRRTRLLECRMKGGERVRIRVNHCSVGDYSTLARHCTSMH